MRKICGVFALLCLSTLAKADSLTTQQIAQQIKAGTDLTLKQGVANVWASNLLTAQGQVDYGGPESLELSINAVLKALGLEQSLAGLSWCGLTNCIWANVQSTIAVDPSVVIGLNPAEINFGEVQVLEPGTLLLLVLGLGWVKIIKKNS